MIFTRALLCLLSPSPLIVPTASHRLALLLITLSIPLPLQTTTHQGYDFAVFPMPPFASSVTDVLASAALESCTLLAQAAAATSFVPLLEAVEHAGSGTLAASLQWVAHLGVPVVVLGLPSCDGACCVAGSPPIAALPGSRAAALARDLLAALQPPPGGSPAFHVWVRVSLCCGWRSWAALKALLGGAHASVSVALHVPSSLLQRRGELTALTAPALHLELQRWLGEPLKAVFMGAYGEEAGGAGASAPPLLPWFLTHLMGRRLQFVVCSSATTPYNRRTAELELLAATRDACAAAAPALGSLPFRAPEGQPSWEAAAGLLQGQDTFIAFNDTLQAPLQPLADHLSAGVYEVFERDAAK